MARPATPMTPAPAAEVCADGALSVKDACAFAGIGKSELYAAVGRGELEFLYHGRKPLVPKRLLVAWLAVKLERARLERSRSHTCLKTG